MSKIYNGEFTIFFALLIILIDVPKKFITWNRILYIDNESNVYFL